MFDITTLNSLSQAVLILISVVVVKLITANFITSSQLNFFQFYCRRLSDKVNKPQNSSSQQKIAGLVAMAITIAPVITILWLFEAFIEVDWLWQSVLLYFALGSCNIAQQSTKICQYLSSNQKYQAKAVLSPLVLRDTEQLSTLGLTKATIEMQLLRAIQEYFVVAMLFIIFGPLMAISYRLILEMHYSWNSKQQAFSSFGLHSHYIINLIQWFPARIFTLVLLLSNIGQNFSLISRLIAPHFFKLNNDVAICCLAYSLETKLGGVAMYNQIKLRKPSFNDKARQPEVVDIKQGKNRIQYVFVFSIICLVLTTVLGQVISNTYR